MRLFAAAFLLLLSSAFAQDRVLCSIKTDEELASPGEIRSGSDRVLRGTIELTAETRTITEYKQVPPSYTPGDYRCRRAMLRVYHGYRGYSLDEANRVTRLAAGASPGPTLRAAAGDTVQLMFFNRIDISQFSLTSSGSVVGQDCDTAFNTKGVETYPGKNPDGTVADTFPNCFHASNTANLHFHGTHVSPGGFADNVLIGVLPDKSLDVPAATKMLDKAFASWSEQHPPSKDLQAAAETALDKMRKDANDSGNKTLAAQLEKAMASNLESKSAGEWPQYWPGWYPYRFQLPVAAAKKDEFPRMGQAPGTHWYHSHQHGSTSLQLLNGMSGLFIITGDYDDKLLRLGGGTPDKPKIKEKVMIFQVFSDQVNLINNRAKPGIDLTTLVAVNGQVLPKVMMKKGEVQWWRMANATIRAHGSERYFFLTKAAWQLLVDDPAKLTAGTYPGGGAMPAEPSAMTAEQVPAFSQTAQDGVQFHWKTYDAQKGQLQFRLAPGNRVDALVKAPAAEGEMYLVVWPPAVGKAQTGPPAIKDIRNVTILRVVVSGDPATENTKLPTEVEFPVQPDFLADILADETNERHRALKFSMTGVPGAVAPIPQFFIDGRKFTEGVIDQVMLMGTAEDWTLRNTSLTGVMHPFHIHVNPFQVTEIFDPTTMDKPQVQPQPWVWRDTVAIPPGLPSTLPDGTKTVTAGHVKIRHRFVDFPGKFVLHCHILGHEDRGMMQMIEVVDNRTAVKHH